MATYIPNESVTKEQIKAARGVPIVQFLNDMHPGKIVKAKWAAGGWHSAAHTSLKMNRRIF